MSLTPKQEKFCQCIVSGMSGKDSYMAAYDCNGSDQMLYNESSKLLAREDIQERLKILRKPLERQAVATAISEREKKRSIIWERIEYCISQGNDNAVARYMDILNKMDSEYLNINVNRDDTTTPLDNLDAETLKALAVGNGESQGKDTPTTT